MKGIRRNVEARGGNGVKERKWSEGDDMDEREGRKGKEKIVSEKKRMKNKRRMSTERSYEEREKKNGDG